jgi:hypothetical protein
VQDFRLVLLLTDRHLELDDAGPNQVINKMLMTKLKLRIHILLMKNVPVLEIIPRGFTSTTPSDVCDNLTSLYTHAILSPRVWGWALMMPADVFDCLGVSQAQGWFPLSQCLYMHQLNNQNNFCT